MCKLKVTSSYRQQVREGLNMMNQRQTAEVSKLGNTSPKRSGSKFHFSRILKKVITQVVIPTWI